MLPDTSHGVKKCIEIALRCVEADRVKRPTIAEVVDELSKIDTTIIDELNKIDTARNSPTEQVYFHTVLMIPSSSTWLFFLASVHRLCLSS